MIIKADKGNATVVLNRQDYEDKLNTMLEDGTYRKLENPTSKIERQISEVLKECEKKGNMTKECRLKLTPRTSVPPQLYGLPKVVEELWRCVCASKECLRQDTQTV